MTLPKRGGGKGLIDTENKLHNGQIKLLRKYFHKMKEITPLYHLKDEEQEKERKH